MEHPFTTATHEDESERAARIAILPVGSYEPHGDHLPLVTDTLIACALAREIATAYDLWLLPPITMSCSYEHSGWPGAISVSARTLYDMVTDISRSAERSGADRLLIVDGTGGNHVLVDVVQEANVSGPRMALFPSREDWDHARACAGMRTHSGEDIHGGELEVSLLLHTHPDLVGPGATETDFLTPYRPTFATVGMYGYAKQGIIGRPSLASKEAGERLLAELVGRSAAHLCALIESGASIAQ